MEAFLQFGFGMMEHCRHLLANWEGGTVVLSPRDLNSSQLIRLAKDVKRIPGSNTLLDPQFYLPHADHVRLCSHAYWPEDFQSGTFWYGPPLTKLLNDLKLLNAQLDTDAFILPGTLASIVDDGWIAIQQSVIEEAASLCPDTKLIATIALSADAAKSESQVAELLESVAHWPQVTGYYLVVEHPNGKYLVDDPIWVANVLDIVAGLRLSGRSVICGYCNHQMLVAACAGASAICSGTWMNVRSFPPDKFRAVYDEEIKQRATWYYCPESLSEYKIPFLDVAKRQGLLTFMKPSEQFDDRYVASLFGGSQPSSVGFTEQSAFRHYLSALRHQVVSARHETFDETVRAHEQMLNAADLLLTRLSAVGVTGQKRDFGDVLDANRAALGILKSTRGAMLRHRWSELG